MEIITVYKDSYQSLLDREFDHLMELATLKGKINALATMEDNPKFVFAQLKEIAEKDSK